MCDNGQRAYSITLISVRANRRSDYAVNIRDSVLTYLLPTDCWSVEASMFGIVPLSRSGANAQRLAVNCAVVSLFHVLYNRVRLKCELGVLNVGVETVTCGWPIDCQRFRLRSSRFARQWQSVVPSLRPPDPSTYV